MHFRKNRLGQLSFNLLHRPIYLDTPNCLNVYQRSTAKCTKLTKRSLLREAISQCHHGRDEGIGLAVALVSAILQADINEADALLRSGHVVFGNVGITHLPHF